MAADSEPLFTVTMAGKPDPIDGIGDEDEVKNGNILIDNHHISTILMIWLVIALYATIYDIISPFDKTSPSVISINLLIITISICMVCEYYRST